MSIVQFLRMFWARRLLILGTTLSCLLGAALIILIEPPSWAAHSRMMLNVFKPDPVTGEVIAGPALRSYVSTQVQLMKDYSVVGPLVDQLGWATDPRLIEQYHKSGDVRDFRHWLAQRIIQNTKVKLLEDSNILDLSYSGPTPDQARTVADALRRSYMETSVAFKRQQASQSADWYQQQANKAKVALATAQDAIAAYEKESGVVLQSDSTDLEAARLQALAQSPAGSEMASVYSSPAATQLAQVDSQLAQQSRILGPNHPELKQLMAQRDALKAQVGGERAAASRAAAGTQIKQAVQEQKARVIADSSKTARLKQLQADVDIRKDEYNKTAQRSAELRQQALTDDSGLTVLGPATTPKDPDFPNIPLILGGAFLGGFGIGVLLALIIELVNRRVRSPEDLQRGLDAPLLAVIESTTNAPAGPKTRPARRGGSKTSKLAQA